MNLPVGMLIYKAQRFSENEAMIMGIWYYKEIFVPNRIEDKKKSGEDLKNKRCTVLTLNGTFDQICEIIMQSDRYGGGSDRQIESYNTVVQKLTEATGEPVMFDEIFAIRGTSLSIDVSLDVEDNKDTLGAKINTWKPVDVKISPNWSFFNEFFDGFR